MSPITTHVLDVSLGRPAANISVLLEFLTDDVFQEIARGITNSDGRVADWMGDRRLVIGQYRIRFDTAAYFVAIGCPEYFYPEVDICFEINDASAHYHVPLLLSPFGYSTYRGS